MYCDVLQQTWERICEQVAILQSMYCSVLEKYHGISMNLRTLKRRLRDFGLRKRNEVYLEHEVWEIIEREIEGPSSHLFLKT